MDEKSLRIDGKAEREPSSSPVQNKSRQRERKNKGDRKLCSCDKEIRISEAEKMFCKWWTYEENTIHCLRWWFCSYIKTNRVLAGPQKPSFLQASRYIFFYCSLWHCKNKLTHFYWPSPVSCRQDLFSFFKLFKAKQARSAAWEAVSLSFLTSGAHQCLDTTQLPLVACRNWGSLEI